MRRINCPPCLRANSQLNKAVRTPPMCRKPVGLGAKRVRTMITCLGAKSQLKRLVSTPPMRKKPVARRAMRGQTIIIWRLATSKRFAIISLRPNLAKRGGWPKSGQPAALSHGCTGRLTTVPRDQGNGVNECLLQNLRCMARCTLHNQQRILGVVRHLAEVCLKQIEPAEQAILRVHIAIFAGRDRNGAVTAQRSKGFVPSE